MNDKNKNTLLIESTADFMHIHHSLYRREIADWQNARSQRLHPARPLTFELQQAYRDAMLDNHLSGAINNRILRVTNKQFLLKDPDNNPDEKRSAYLHSRWFKDLVRLALESKFFGYSMVYFHSDGHYVHLRQIPRENIIPEQKLILKNPLNPSDQYLHFTDYPYNLIYIQLLPDSIGILEKVVPLTIFKRHSWAAWDEFEQLFGVPIRIARTMINTKKHLDELQDWLESMGSLSYAILDKRVDLEIKENNKTDAFRVFAEKINLINKEISKAILGQTMTMDDGSSQSQATVHLAVMDEITNADIADIEDWFNSYFIHILRYHGFDIPDGYYLDIVANASLDPAEKIKVDEALLRNGYRLSPEYIEQTYEVKLDKNHFSDPDTLSYPYQHTLPDFFD